MSIRSICGIDNIPLWFQAELFVESSEPDMNTIIKLLLKDYLRRNAPIAVHTTEAEFKSLQEFTQDIIQSALDLKHGDKND